MYVVCFVLPVVCCLVFGVWSSLVLVLVACCVFSCLTRVVCCLLFVACCFWLRLAVLPFVLLVGWSSIGWRLLFAVCCFVFGVLVCVVVNCVLFGIL